MLKTVVFPDSCVGAPPGILLGTTNGHSTSVFIVAVVHFPITPKNLNTYLSLHQTKVSDAAKLQPIGTWFPAGSWEGKDEEFRDLIPNLFGKEKWMTIRAETDGNCVSFYVEHCKKSAGNSGDTFNGMNYEKSDADTVVVIYKQKEIWGGEIEKDLLIWHDKHEGLIEILFTTVKSSKDGILSYECALDSEEDLRITHCCVKREVSLIHFLLSFFTNIALTILCLLVTTLHGLYVNLPHGIVLVLNFLSKCAELSSFCAHIKKRCADFGRSLMGLYGNNAEKTDYQNHNVVASVFADIFFGIAFLWYLHRYDYLWSNNTTRETFLPYVDAIARQVEELIKWIMGIPAGLKLNHPLNQFLGHFFLYHVRLWLEYAKMMMDFFPNMVVFCLMSSCFGFSFFLSLIADAVSTLSFHVYCFYVYAGRLYGLQVSGLMSMWRLFRGKKWNPLRKRVDSLEESGQRPDQLFAGTLLFTVLLFLLPTTALYYAIFMLLRVAVLAVQVILSSLTFFFSEFPWYSFVRRIASPHKFTKSVRVAWKSPQICDPVIKDDGQLLHKVSIDHHPGQAVLILMHIHPVPIFEIVKRDLNRRKRFVEESYGVRNLLKKLIIGDLIRWS